MVFVEPMRRSIREVLNLLRAGSVPRARLYDLSGLDQAEVKEVEAVWRDLPVRVRREVILTLVEVAESDFEADFGAVFRIALDDPDAMVREAAVEGLWEDEDVRLVPRFAAFLREDPAPNVRAAAAASLGRFLLLGELGKIRPLPHRQAYEALLEACRAVRETLEVRRRALEALAYSGEEEVADLISEAYQHPEEKMRISAVFAMGRSADERWAAHVLQELLNPNPEMRFEAARACGELGLEDAVATLIELVEDVDTEVQEAAIWALGQIGGDEARSTLKRCLRSENEALREAARDALRELEFLHGDLGVLLLPFDFFDEEEEDFP
ncbi:MAG TPA: hypothetical protein EYH27_03640 [Anaerolineales bacterium]|nr:hypothetical protein [Anaerolineae bacterium]HIP87513.1 hypothetical protein [Anaerolineales bacterium]